MSVEATDLVFDLYLLPASGTASRSERHGAMKVSARIAALAASLLVLAVGCSAVGASPTPISEAGAVAAVLAQDARFTGIGPLQPNAIGQSAWYEVASAADGGYGVDITIGWGDCPAGCIDHHVWHYAVSAGGVVTKTGESGAPLPDGATGVRGAVTSGPTCPVMHVPPDPACAERPVVGALIIATDASGAQAGRATSGADGTYGLTLGPGVYTLTAQPFEGLMGTPAPQTVSIDVAGGSVEVDFSYDTGIR
ncbi:MAG: carboxypeptidase-like regulatory domain-containing protein [Candidatus Limnocylindrales bacterium]